MMYNKELSEFLQNIPSRIDNSIPKQNPMISCSYDLSAVYIYYDYCCDTYGEWDGMDSTVLHEEPYSIENWEKVKK